MKKSLALIMSFIMIFSTFSVCTVSASAATAAPAAVVSEQEDEIQLDSQFALMFRSLIRTFTNGIKKRIGVKNLSVIGVDLNKRSADILAGETISLTATVKPADASNKKIIWTLTDYGIASINANGAVTGKKNGTVTVYAVTEDGKFYDTCNVSVHGSTNYIPCTGLTVGKSSVSLEKGSSCTINVTKSPSNTHDTLSLHNSNAGVVTASFNSSNDLVIKALGKGTATVTVKCGTISKKINVTVTEKEVTPPDLSCTGLTVAKSSVELKEGGSTTVKITKTPSNSTDAITLINSNTAVIKVSLDSSNNAVIKAVAAGTATVTVKCGSITKKINVTVSSNKAWTCENGVLTILKDSAFNEDMPTVIWSEYCNNYNITELIISDEVTFIPDETFIETNLKTVTIGKGVKIIGNKAFAGCEDLTKVILSEGLTEIGAAAFSKCYNLSKINLPHSIKTIGGNAFLACESLEPVNLPHSIESIGYHAFYCNKVLVVYFWGSESQLKNISNSLAFENDTKFYYNVMYS